MTENLNEKLIEEGKVFPTINYEDTIFLCNIWLIFDYMVYINKYLYKYSLDK